MFPCALRAFGNRLHEKYKMVSKKSITFFFSHKKKKKIQTHGIYTALGELKKKKKKKKRNTKSEIQDLYSSFD